MSRRPEPEPLSPRALARLRASPRSWVPTSLDLDGPGRDDHGHDRGVDGHDRGADGHGRGADGHGRGVDGPRRDVDSPDPGDAGGEATGRWAGGGPAAVLDDEAEHRGGRHTRAAHPRGWVRLPAAFVGARWQPGRAALVGVVIVAALAAAVFGLRVVWAQSAGGGTVIAPGGGSRAGPSGVTAGAVPVGVTGASGSPGVGATPATPATGGGAAASGAGVPTASEVVVHVVGQVRRPGLRRLPLGSRVADAVDAAGGATAKADLGRVNLARVLVDGEQVRVPKPGEPVEPVAGTGAGGGGAGTGGTGGASGGAAGAPVSLNTADLATLDTLPGVGPVLAQRILDWRAAHGRFASVDELGEVSGIGDTLLTRLTPLVTL